MSKTEVSIKLRQLYCISFIEGGVVMVTELAGAKLLTPFFGASLYSWASTLSITLLALMAGYYFGGYVTTKPRFSSSDKIVWVFLLSGLLVLLMPFLGHFIMQRTISFSFFVGLVLSQLFFLFFPIFLMGMISPMIIFQVTKKAELSGRSAGNIYAISTSGGILFTMIFGFVIIPDYGISMPVKLLGLAVCALALIFLLKEKLTVKKVPLALALILITAAVSFNQASPGSFSPLAKTTMLNYSEGLLGELKVMDQVGFSPNGEPVTIRKLKVNNIQQNYVFTKMPTQSLLYYVNFTKQLVKFAPRKQTGLLIGLGAGSLFKILYDQGIQVETVEIDRRIYDIGIKYFEMPEHFCTITDGRYFINVTKKKYDLIILDVIIGESVPGQLITLESFKRLGELLNPGGTLIIEHGGVNSFAGNAFVPSIAKTLNAAGFQVSIFNPLLSDQFGDVMFMATKEKFDVSKYTVQPDVLIKAGPLSSYVLSLDNFDTADAVVLTDDNNKIDMLLKSHYLEVRKGIRKELAKMKSTSGNF